MEDIGATLRAALQARVLQSESRAAALSRLAALTSAIGNVSQAEPPSPSRPVGLRGLIERLTGVGKPANEGPAAFAGRLSALAGSLLSDVAAAQAAVSAQPLCPIPPLATRQALHSAPGATASSLEWDEPSREISSGANLDVLYVVGLVEGQSRRYRVHNPVAALQAKGLAAAAVALDALDAALDAGITARRVVLFRGDWTDSFDRLAQRVRSQGGQVYADVDDLIFEPEAIGFVHAIAGWPKSSVDWFADNMRRFRRALQLSDCVVVTTPFLAGLARQIHPNVRVAPNTLNADQMRMAENEPAKAPFPVGAATLGYLSGTATHQADFAQASAGIAEVMRRHPGVRLMVVGPLALSEEIEAMNDRIDRYDFMPYLDMLAMLRRIDINLAPLEVANPFCDGKSELKIFEAGAMWTPTVASPTATYTRAIEPSADGWLAASPAAWLETLDRLVCDPVAVAAAGAAARRRALAQFSPAVCLQSTLIALDLGSEISPT